MSPLLTWRRALLAPSVALIAFAGLTAATEQTARAQSSDTQPTTGTGTGTTDSTTPQSGDTQPKKEEPKPATEAQTNATATEAKATAETSKPTPATEEAEHEEKEAKHAVYLSADVSFTRVDLGAFHDNTNFDKTGANGVSYAFGVGYRHEDWRFGFRFRASDTTEFNLWSMMLEAGYGLKLRPIQPIFLVHAGYVFDTHINQPVFGSSVPRGSFLTPDVDVKGAVVGVEAVGSFWFTKFARLGPYVGFDMMFLNRARADLPPSIFQIPDDIRNSPLYTDSGSGIGYVFNVGVRGTVDIGW